MTEANKPSCV